MHFACESHIPPFLRAATRPTQRSFLFPQNKMSTIEALAAAAVGGSDVAAIDSRPRALSELTKEYKYWMEANLIKELASLRTAGKAIRGVYVMPSHETLQVWHGCLFLHTGIFAGACFKFVMTFPETTEGLPEVSPPNNREELGI